MRPWVTVKQGPPFLVCWARGCLPMPAGPHLHAWPLGLCFFGFLGEKLQRPRGWKGNVLLAP
jgi:hypothetical protein